MAVETMEEAKESVISGRRNMVSHSRCRCITQLSIGTKAIVIIRRIVFRVEVLCSAEVDTCRLLQVLEVLEVLEVLDVLEVL